MKKYKKMNRQPLNFLVDEADLETIDHNNESNEDIFSKESIVNTANKIFHFHKYKKEQATYFLRYKKQQTGNELDDADSINYVDDINFDDVRENKNVKIAAKKITEKYKKLSRKRKQQQKLIAITVEGFWNPSKKRKKTTKSALITARNIAKKSKSLRYW